jgi:hypothetical protein
MLVYYKINDFRLFTLYDCHHDPKYLTKPINNIQKALHTVNDFFSLLEIRTKNKLRGYTDHEFV